MKARRGDEGMRGRRVSREQGVWNCEAVASELGGAVTLTVIAGPFEDLT